MAKQPCKCGRRWFPRYKSQFGYAPICPGCNRSVAKCDCEPVARGTELCRCGREPVGDYCPTCSQRRRFCCCPHVRAAGEG